MRILIFFTIAAAIIQSFFTIGTTSFTVDYIHRDSPLSPYHNSSQTQYERLHATLLRNTAAVLKRRSKLQDLSIESKVYPNNQSDYLMSISMGTPPMEILAIADTGSELVWTDCEPCKKCYAQNASLFNPKRSSTFQQVSCDSKICHGNCIDCNSHNECSYSYIYGDGSVTKGAIVSETLTFSSSTGEQRRLSIPNINVGCSHETEGIFQSNEAGIIGLNDKPLSLISQLGSKIDNKFSYCLVPYGNEKSFSKFTFGPNENIDRLASLKIPFKPYYTLQLKSLSVGDTYVDMPAILINGGEIGNIMIDSGTTFTFLPTCVFEKLSSAISRLIILEPAKDPNDELQFCYRVGERRIWEDGLPDVNLNFENGVVLRLPPLNTFLKVSDSILCLAMIDNKDISILGSVAQQNFLIQYDLKNRLLSLATTDCQYQL